VSEESTNQTDHQPSSATSQEIHLPRPTMWPAIMAAGITMAMAGIILSLAFSVGGVIVFFIALFGWISELRHEG
jgi:hypothetical protein